MDRRVENQDLVPFTRGTEVYRMATGINCQITRHCRAGFVCYELVARTYPYAEKYTRSARPIANPQFIWSQLQPQQPY